jgi:hypothetical protein
MHEELTKECPDCPKTTTKRGTVRGVQLELVSDNYSGCGVDICRCPECGRDFQVSYKVDRITRIGE